MWINYPNMPTGANAKWETFTELIDWAKEKKIFF